MEIIELKAMAYDLIAQKESVEIRLRRVNQEIAKIMDMQLVEQKKELKAKAKKEEKHKKTKIGSITTV